MKNNTARFQLSLLLPRFILTMGMLGALLLTAFLWPTLAFGAGLLSPVGSGQPLVIQDHDVRVAIDNGFARTTVVQTFSNPNPQQLEAIYSFPAPEDAVLADVTIHTGETVLRGEVVAKDKARKVYEEETNNGNDAGLAERDGYQDFRFHVYPVRPGENVQVSFTYYQSLHIDNGVGRYVYPLQAGGTDGITPTFWSTNDQVDGRISFDVALKSAYPVQDVRSPGLEGSAQVNQAEDGSWQLSYTGQSGLLNRDFVFYYRLQENLPGRVELIPYKTGEDATGTFMLVVTPGLDLQPLDAGVDYLFVLDTSGSMNSKIATLAKGVQQAIGQLRPQDRYRIVTFSTSAHVFCGWTPATEANIRSTIDRLQRIGVDGGTNLEAGLRLALRDIDDERVTNMILVTDGVANTGNVSPAFFHKFLGQYDVRFFAFLMGNSANYPLMEVLCDASGGYYAPVSNADDIVGQILMAKSKVTHQALQDFSVELESENVHFSDLTGDAVGKVFRGQQVVLFGRYEGAGAAILRLKLRVSGEDRSIELPLTLPEQDTANPELERLWAIQRIKDAEFNRSLGAMSEADAQELIQGLGVNFQIVTDETSMLVLDDAAFERNSVTRHNAQRVATETAAQTQRAQAPAHNYTQAQGGNLGNNSGGVTGGGALDPRMGLIGIVALFGLAALGRKRPGNR